MECLCLPAMLFTPHVNYATVKMQLNWVCRWGYKHVEELADVVAKYKAADIPLEVMWTDIDYMDGYRDFSLDPSHFSKDKMQASPMITHLCGSSSRLCRTEDEQAVIFTKLACHLQLTALLSVCEVASQHALDKSFIVLSLIVT